MCYKDHKRLSNHSLQWLTWLMTSPPPSRARNRSPAAASVLWQTSGDGSSRQLQLRHPPVPFGILVPCSSRLVFWRFISSHQRSVFHVLGLGSGSSWCHSVAGPSNNAMFMSLWQNMQFSNISFKPRQKARRKQIMTSENAVTFNFGNILRGYCSIRQARVLTKGVEIFSQAVVAKILRLLNLCMIVLRCELLH